MTREKFGQLGFVMRCMWPKADSRNTSFQELSLFARLAQSSVEQNDFVPFSRSILVT